MDDQTRRDEKLQTRIEEYEACEGYRIQHELWAFRTGYHIFMGNYSELKKALAEAQDPRAWPYLWDARQRYRWQRFNTEITRLLHNYVATVMSLVVHTRNFVRAKYVGTDFIKEYQERVDRDFAHDPLVQFVQDLRDYMLHKSLAAASLILRTGDGGLAFKSYVALVPDKLREWDRWSKEARPYLDALDNQRSLEEIIDTYRTKVMEFWMWLEPRLGEEHREAFHEMARLEDRIREVDPNWESGYGVVYTAKGTD